MSSSDPVTNTSGPRYFQMDDPGTAAADAAKNGVTQASPFQSLGERPEMELDLWEGQFNLSSPTIEQFSTSLSTEDLQQLGLVEGDSSTCWGEDSAVTMGTFQHLQDQVGMLTEAQATDEERYTLVKQDNSTLSSRIFMLEEQLREAKEKSLDSLKMEMKRNKEQIEKLERERQIAHDNFSIRIQRLEVENIELREKTEDLRTMLDVAISEKGVVEEQLAEMQLVVLREEEQQTILKEEMEDKVTGWEQEREANSNTIQEFSLEIIHLKRLKLDSSETDSGCHLQDVDDTFGDLTTRIIEMESELRSFKKSTKMLQIVLENGVEFGLMDKNQDLEGEILTKGLDEGTELLLNQSNTKTLAAELEEMSENESRKSVEAEISKLRTCLSEQEDVNLHLQNYIDSVLLNIMERHPDILEIRTK